MAALRWLAAAPLLLLWGRSLAQRSDLMQDVDYVVIPQQRLSNTERMEVAYFFYYGCQWCFQFEPLIAEWLKEKPVDVSFRRIPALRNSRWITRIGGVLLILVGLALMTGAWTEFVNWLRATVGVGEVSV